MVLGSVIIHSPLPLIVGIDLIGVSGSTILGQERRKVRVRVKKSS